MFILGLNAVYHDSAACLVKDGKVIAAAEEERFTHEKHGKRPIPFSTYELPFHSIDYCLRAAGIRLHDLDHVAYSYNPYLLLGRYQNESTITLPLEPSAHPTPEEWEAAWDPLFLSHIMNAPRQLRDGVPHHLQDSFRNGTVNQEPFRWHYVDHHVAHAASAYYASPFSSAAVLTLDGRGERATTSYSHGRGNKMFRIGEVLMPHSLGILYERLTTYLGFLHSSDEYKVMALASYGSPTFKKDFNEIIKIQDNGLYTVAPIDFVEHFGAARARGGPFEKKHFDMAHSLQVVLEEKVLQLVDWLHRVTHEENLCMAGGVALNCVMNARVRDRGPFKNIWVQPAAGDAGTALGAALWIDALEREGGRNYVMDHAFLGPEYSDEEIEKFLYWAKLPYRRLDHVAEEVADLLVEDKIIGWFQGRMEFGPRALGGRSIIASPIHASMQARLNEIKDREDFRPVAPVVLEEEAEYWFENARVSPFMLFVFDVIGDKSERIPAVRHVDGTARVQTINRSQNSAYYDLLKAFKAKTGVPVLINTSFNTRGEPIVCSPRDAIECFWTSPLDALVIGSYLLEKNNLKQVGNLKNDTRVYSRSNFQTA
jgi:carbamoyltransferase